jgi:hypothetical protein
MLLCSKPGRFAKVDDIRHEKNEKRTCLQLPFSISGVPPHPPP